MGGERKQETSTPPWDKKLQYLEIRKIAYRRKLI